MAKGFKFLAIEQHEYGDPIRLNAGGQSAISLGGVLENKIGGISVNLGIRFRLDKGFGRVEDIIKQIKEVRERLDDDGIRDFLRDYIEPDIRSNIDTIFERSGINAYGDGINWPDNSRLWKWFKEKHKEEENVPNPFYNINSKVQFIPKIKYTDTGMLTGALRDALSNQNSTEEHKLIVKITGKNLYIGSSMPYLSTFQQTRPVLFIGEKQKQAWLSALKDYALLNPSEITNLQNSKTRNRLLDNILKTDEGKEAFGALGNFSSISKGFRKKSEDGKEVKAVKEEEAEVDVNELSVKNKQQVKGFSKYLKTKQKNNKKGM
jgi:hypothetical protein